MTDDSKKETSTVTGRINKPSPPNIQNIPIRTPEGVLIRQAVINWLTQGRKP